MDSTQGMVQELHTVNGSVLARVGVLEGEMATKGAYSAAAEAAGAAGSSRSGGSISTEDALRPLQVGAGGNRSGRIARKFKFQTGG